MGAKMQSQGEKSYEIKSAFFDSGERHDFILAITMLIGFMQGLGLIILAIPYFAFGYSLAFGARVPKETQKIIREWFDLSRRVYIRKSRNGDSHVFSLPGNSILYIDPYTLENLSSSKSIGKIYHEKGHIGYHDRIISLWLYTMLIFTLFVAIVNIPIELSEVSRSGLYDVSTRTGYLNLVLMGLCPLVAIFLIRRVSHRREYQADNFANHAAPNDIKRFLELGALRQPHIKVKGVINKIKKTSIIQSFQIAYIF